MSIHIFWDNSNVWGGIGHIKTTVEPSVPWYALRVHFRNLYELISKGRLIETKIMAGSVPPECEDLWEYARNLGFNTDLLTRVDNGLNVSCEQAVDELLHLKMANAILDFDPPQTMVLLSGDSKDSDYGTSFPKQLERALKKDWSVEVYTVEGTYSKRLYRPLLDSYSGKIHIIDLAPFYENISFVKGGEYYNKDASDNKIYFTVKDRVVKPLP